MIFELIDFGKGVRAKTFYNVQILLHARILPNTAYSNPVISEVGIKKGLARLIYIIVYSKIKGQRCFF